MLFRTISFLAAVTLCRAALEPADSYQPRNTQPPGSEPPTAQQAAQAWKLPPGFQATLFAGEPDVRQPIDLKIDDRGRVWVCEGYAYKEWQKKGEDRVVILTDANGDGTADQRKVFRGGFNHLSSVEIGFGGVWVLDTPNLLFFPDKDGDDLPDGEPEILLDGWTEKGGHNMVNGLQWGIDGWLYGRHGITQPSLVGKPGTPENERTFIEPGIWRFHPVTRKFEVLVRGSTNPWGLDWDENGEMFMSGNVNGHLWHCVPGALFERMFGAGSVPNDYERLKMIGEATHYPSSGDWKQDWLKPDKGRDAANDLGGGHSHCGLMIYQGDNWPAEFRGHLFMCNTHGRRINRESLHEKGSSYTSRHVGDPFVMDTPWFRGVSLLSGPDGAVYVSDWCDNGECHDDDGVHRTSGRIYKISYGTPKASSPQLQAATDTELAAQMLSENEWHVRHARRLLQERVHSAQGISDAARKMLERTFATAPQLRDKLRAFWTLHACGALTAEHLLTDTKSPQWQIRSWAARFLVERSDAAELAAPALVQLAKTDPEPRMLAHLAGVVPRLAPDVAWALVRELVARPESAADHTLELLIWYALEPLIPAHAREVAGLMPSASTPLLRKFIARRLTVDMDNAPMRDAVGQLLALAATTANLDVAGAILTGVRDGLSGRTHVAPPGNWPQLVEKLHPRSPALATAIGLAFGDEAILTLLRQRFQDAARAVEERSQALESLVIAKVPDLPSLLEAGFSHEGTRLAAIRGYSAVSSSEVAARLLGSWAKFSAAEKSAAVDTMASRIGTAVALLEALGGGRVQRSDLDLTQVRQLQTFKNKKVQDLLEANWGKLTSTTEEKRAEMEKYKKILTSAKGNPVQGKVAFTRTCAGCHTLFGQGGKLGPDLTGTGRKEADYILLNVLDPNAVIPRDYQLTVVTLKDGQILSGTVPREDDKTLTVQNLAERRVVERSVIARVERQPVSWMPEGLLSTLSEQEVRDLVAYLASDGGQ